MTTNILETLKQKPYITGLLITLFILITYLPTINTYLMSDDFEWLNSSYSGWQNPSELLKPINNFFRPLVKFSYLLNYTLFKTHALFYNIFTVLIHLVNVLLLYFLIFKITRRITPAALISLLYGSSAIYSEVTLWAAGRPDSLLLIFILSVLILYNNLEEKKQPGRHILLFILTLCAAAAKETWILLPCLAVGLVWLVKQTPLKTTLKSTSSLFVLMIIYVGYFIILPKLTGASAFTSYGKLGIKGALKKFGFMISKYVGLDKAFTGAFWQIALIVVVLAALGYWLIRRKNRLALYGLLWMLMTIGITLSIHYAPSRYNYLPLVGFWIMIAAWLEKDIKDLLKKIEIEKLSIILVIGVPILFYLALQVIMLQKEIKDYHQRGSTHKVLVDMYLKVKDQLPHDRPIVFIDLGQRRAVDELRRSIKGYKKLLFVRNRAIWQQVFLAPLANFAGNPFSIRMKPIPAAELEALFQKDFTALVFTDMGFFISDAYKQKVRDFYYQHGQLPYKVQALRFVQVKAVK
ncbi:MAG: hypothetical protein JSV88_13180 [Candidatus Aminicenantes bacterium]|nr:MAG: hypothetical protein JSV88_13180 [Candidatus Aminicenantes bacterium]